MSKSKFYSSIKVKTIIKILNYNATSINTGSLDSILKTGISANESVDTDGRTPLHLAAGIFQEEISLKSIKILIKYSANPNFPNNEGKTSLHVAASLGHQKVLQLLICNGGDVLRSDLKGNTPIDTAFLYQQMDTVYFLNVLLDTEEYESSNKENFKTFLWNKQLREIDGTTDFLYNIPMAISCSICKQNLILKRNVNTQRSTDMFESKSLNNSNLVKSNMKNTFNSSSSITNIDISGIDYLSITAEDSFRINLQENLEYLSQTNIFNEGFCCSYARSLLSCSENTSNNSDNKISKRENSGSCCNCDILSSLSTSTGVISSSSSQSYVTVVEEYIYTDDEKGVEFIERRFPGSANISLISSENRSTTFYTIISSMNNSETKELSIEETKESLPESVINLSGKTLRIKLKELGFNAGPVTGTTCKILQKYYHKLRTRPIRKEEISDINDTKKYSKELEKFLHNPSFDESYYELLDEKMSEPFINPDDLSWWRNGNYKTCFNYLLLDPRVTANLALRRSNFSNSELFQKFLSSVFYIGKGTRSRPYFHLYEAQSETPKSNKNLKVQKIKEIWATGLGVISLHVFQNTIPVEAWTREASMISAFGLNNLTNSIQGTFYGPASTWKKNDQKKFGSFCLFQAFNILLYEGERQIFPNDIPIPKWNH